MTSTSEFFGQGATLTVHHPPGSSEAVLMIETMDAVASITLPRDEVQRLLVLLHQHGPSPETDDPVVAGAVESVGAGVRTGA